MNELRVALIGGNGVMGKAHSLGYSLAPLMADLGVSIRKAVLVDATDELAADAAQRLGWEESSSNWREVISRPDIDIIDIVTPPHIHKEIAVEALKLGKHVFVEKPITNDSTEALEMWEAQVASGAAGQVGFNYRHIPAIQFAKKLVDEGRIGTALQFRATYLQDVLLNVIDFGWRGKTSTGASGMIGDIGSHVMDMAEYLNGDIVRVCGLARARENGAAPEVGWLTEDKRAARDMPDQAGVWVAEFANGAIGTFAVSLVASGRKNLIRWELDGTKGALEFNWNRREELGISYADDPADHSGFRSVLSTHEHEDVWYNVPGLGLGYVDDNAIQMYKFVKSIAEHKLAHPNFGEAAHTQQLVEAVLESSKTGTWVDVARTPEGAR
ncbi:putative dehydrogenase [Microbacterium sp. W4I4]|uniref:Gfo/Idh/MocA family protein n=1 Tax=Microbacterium sp. W4I4 TaxID=3042295 RepID=UPI0027849984|nr:Gfo/Idh/MocA family oxidoreductase [Microbacterium sp. W4I4]MDQ0615358.1 putative dehydrogenase [Microbacterium sp. W4I4]